MIEDLKDNPDEYDRLANEILAKFAIQYEK